MEQIETFRTVIDEVISPILAVAKSLNDEAAQRTNSRFNHQEQLTAAEIRVARLAARGFGYKEIARRLDRSVHTVDHQLRSIRHKLGMTTHAKLVQFLSR